MVNYYDILQIKRNATLVEIKAAFKKLAFQFHPDKNPGNKVSEEKFKIINEAYQNLSDYQKRNTFNQKLDYYDFQSRNNSIKQPTPNPRETYTPPPPNFSAGDFSSQGKHYSYPPQPKKSRISENYIIGFTIFVIIAVVSLIFGFMMNSIAAKDHYSKAVFHYENEDYTKSVMELNDAIGFNSEYSEAYLLRAEIKMKFNWFESALPDYNLAIRYKNGENKPLIQKRDFCREKVKEKQERR